MSEHIYIYVCIHSFIHMGTRTLYLILQLLQPRRVVRGGQAHSLLYDSGVLFPWASWEAAGGRGCSEGLR